MKPKVFLKTSFVYFILAIILGVFFREATKIKNFTQPTALGVLHTHTLVLGTFLFLILFAISLHKSLDNIKLLKKFFVLYNISLVFMLTMILIRGVTQVFTISLSKAQDAMISGFSGISHIMIMISFFILFKCLFDLCKIKK